MQVNYKYASPSMCVKDGGQTVLGLSPDLSREESVSFVGKLKNPLVYRDTMLMLREIVISDMGQKKKERVEFFAWLNQEIEKRMLEHEKYQEGVREKLEKDMNEMEEEIKKKDYNIQSLIKVREDLKKEIDKYDIWNDYYKIERDFWKFIKNRDAALWWILDPVITVHPDQVSFEAFSLDESTYGCLSVDMKEFELLEEPKLGTTNIDFSAKLAKEMERFRTYTDVKLSVNPGGFSVDSGVAPEHIEKKIDLPETWIKGFNQVSAAASLGGIDITLSPVDMYDICSYLRRHKARKSPRYMKWILEPEKRVKILFEPFGDILELDVFYNGKKKKEEKIWGRRRWLVMEKMIPIAKSFKVRLLSFGMPQFIVADLGNMKMTIGFTSWSSNDWVKGTAFNILGGFIGENNYKDIYTLMKKKRMLTFNEIYSEIKDIPKSRNKAGVGMLLKKGEAYFDPINDKVRFRQLCNIPIDEELYKTTDMENQVLELLNEDMNSFSVMINDDKSFIAKKSYKMPNDKYNVLKYRDTDDYKRKYNLSKTEVILNEDGQFSKVDCKCKAYQKGPRNISAPCAHILALYISASKFILLNFEPNKEYKMNDILEMLI